VGPPGPVADQPGTRFERDAGIEDLRALGFEFSDQAAELPLRRGGQPPMRPLLFGLNAGAEYGPAKRWPRDRFIAAAIAMQRQAKCHWWIFGGKSDQPLATEITSGIQSGGLPAGASVQSLAGQTTLRELCAALKACDVVLTNDTGPMHLTAAVGTPVIGLFGSTSPELTAPGLPGDTQHVLLKSDAACAPCFLRTCPIDFRCMNGLTVDQVVGALMEVSGRSH